MNVSLPSPLMNADGGGGGGPVASPFTQGGGGGRGQSQGGDMDTAELLRQLQGEIQQANARASQADQRSQSLAGVLGGIKQAVTGESNEPQEQDWYEQGLLPMLLELEKEGKSHPMTATLARELKKSQEQQRQLMELVQELRNKTQEIQDPQVQNDERAFSQIDDAIIEELTSVYGEPKTNLHRAVAANIAADIQALKAKLPGKWEEIRRDPSKLRRIVQHHITGITPPTARQAMAKQIDDNTPVTMQTLNAAWSEFQQIKHNLDPQSRAEIAANLRQQILAEQFMQSRRLPGRR